MKVILEFGKWLIAMVLGFGEFYVFYVTKEVKQYKKNKNKKVGG